LQQMLGIEKLIYGKYRYDSSTEVNGKTLRTTVVELEHQNHRDIIRSPSLIELLKEDLDPRTEVTYSPFHPKDESTFMKFKERNMDELKELLHEIQEEILARDVDQCQESSSSSSSSSSIPESNTRRVTVEDEQKIHRKKESYEQVKDRCDLTSKESPFGNMAVVDDASAGDDEHHHTFQSQPQSAMLG